MSNAETLKRRLRHLSELLGLGILLPVPWLLGLDKASALFGFLGRNIAARLRHNVRLRESIKRAMPEKSDAEAGAIVAGMWENLFRSGAEFLYLAEFTKPRYQDRIRLQGEELFLQSLQSGRGVVLLSSHLANWELLAPVMARLLGDYPAAGAYRPLRNDFVERHVARIRAEAFGRTDTLVPVEQNRHIRPLMRVLREGGCVHIMIDERIKQGVAARFFGLPAMTTDLPARLAIAGGHILLPASIVREGGARFVYRFHEPIPTPPPPVNDEVVLATTQKINDFLEARVREHPEQWRWRAKRWAMEGTR